MGGNDIARPAHKRITAVGGENDCGCHGGFKKGVEIGEAFNVKHVNLSGLTIRKNDRELSLAEGRTSSIKTTPGTTSATP
jgi:hypothetical protein